MTDLATARLSTRLTNQAGRALVTARNHHVVVDSPPPLGGPNDEVNPLDLLLGALATCAVFVCETAAREMGIPLHNASAAVEGDFDPRGVRGEAVNPRIQAFRVTLHLDGPDEEGATALSEAFRSRCPIFTTLERSAPVDLQVELRS